MEKAIGLIVAVEQYHDGKNLKRVMFAENDGMEFYNSLIALGYKSENLIYLPSHLATKTTIAEKVKQIATYATATDTILFYYAGHGFYHNGQNLISCVDTSLSSLGDTTIDLNHILASLDKSKSNKVIAFLDCCHSGIEFSEIERSPVTDFSTEELKYEYGNAEHLTVFASCKSDEKSQADLERKHGVWTYYLLSALKGEAKGFYDGALLFSDKLQKYLGDNTFQRARLITENKKNQTPVKFGRETTERFIVADLTKIFAEKEVKLKADGIRFEKATILYQEGDWVRNLPGFEKAKGHKAPKVIDDYHNSWVKKIATELIEEELNEIAEELRTKMKYKRKDVEEPVVEDGAGQLRTIDFDYVLSISQSSSHADRYVLTRSIENFKNTNILADEVFNEVFEGYFDRIEFRFNQKLNVEKIIDDIEDIDDETKISVKYDRINTRRCTILLAGFDGKIHLSERTFRITANKKASPQSLVLACQRGYQSLISYGVPKMLN